MRLSSHQLEIETGRYSGIDRRDRLCKLCNQNAIESEYHFIFCCCKYTSIRKKYLDNMQWPTINKFNNLMSSKNSTGRLLVNTAKYIKDATICRNRTLKMINSA